MGELVTTLLDGFHYAAGLLLVRQASHSALLDRVRAHIPRLTVAAFAVWCLVSLAPYSAFYWQSLQEGNDIEPARLFSTVAPSDEQAAIAWFQQHAQPDQLVLAPLDMAPWFATVPMHSFASHYLFSLTFAEQASLTTAFYLGNLEPDAARQILKTYGVRYIVVPERSPAVRYIGADARSTSIGALTVYELDNNSMKPYSRSRP